MSKSKNSSDRKGWDLHNDFHSSETNFFHILPFQNLEVIKTSIFCVSVKSQQKSLAHVSGC